MTVINIVRVFTYKMAAKINWHRCRTKLRHCHPVYNASNRKQTVLITRIIQKLLEYFLESGDTRVPAVALADKL